MKNVIVKNHQAMENKYPSNSPTRNLVRINTIIGPTNNDRLYGKRVHNASVLGHTTSTLPRRVLREKRTVVLLRCHQRVKKTRPNLNKRIHRTSIIARIFISVNRRPVSTFRIATLGEAPNLHLISTIVTTSGLHRGKLRLSLCRRLGTLLLLLTLLPCLTGPLAGRKRNLIIPVRATAGLQITLGRCRRRLVVRVITRHIPRRNQIRVSSSVLRLLVRGLRIIVVHKDGRRRITKARVMFFPIRPMNTNTPRRAKRLRRNITILLISDQTI